MRENVKIKRLYYQEKVTVKQTLVFPAPNRTRPSIWRITPFTLSINTHTHTHARAHTRTYAHMLTQSSNLIEIFFSLPQGVNFIHLLPSTEYPTKCSIERQVVQWGLCIVLVPQMATCRIRKNYYTNRLQDVLRLRQSMTSNHCCSELLQAEVTPLRGGGWERGGG